MTSIPPPSDCFRGRVSERTAKGIRIDGVPDLLIFSKYANGAISPCQVGDTVTVELDDRAFVRALVVEAASERHEARVDARQPGPVSKDVQIVRESVLRTAAMFCSARPECTSKDVFALAERMEAWVFREPSDD